MVMGGIVYCVLGVGDTDISVQVLGVPGYERWTPYFRFLPINTEDAATLWHFKCLSTQWKILLRHNGDIWNT